MISPGVRIFLYTEPVDMRRSFDGLAAITRTVLREDPESGAMFLFVNKRRRHLKALWWDKTGYCLLSKRLHRAVFDLPTGKEGSTSVRLNGDALAQLLAARALPPRGANRST